MTSKEDLRKQIHKEELIIQALQRLTPPAIHVLDRFRHVHRIRVHQVRKLMLQNKLRQLGGKLRKRVVKRKRF